VAVEHCQLFLIVSVSYANSTDMCVLVPALFVSGSRVVVFGHWAAAAAAAACSACQLRGSVSSACLACSKASKTCFVRSIMKANLHRI
jgi:hypothetical protein